VDEDICAADIAPCTDFGVGEVPAASGNTSLVALVVQLIDPRGNPITGLIESDFTFSGPIVGGIPIQIPDCFTCFTPIVDPPGVYRIYVQPTAGWGSLASTKVYRLRIDAGPAILHTLVKIEIP